MNNKNILAILAMIFMVALLVVLPSSTSATRKRVRSTRFPTKRPTSAPTDAKVNPGQEDEDDYEDYYNDNDEGNNNTSTTDHNGTTSEYELTTTAPSSSSGEGETNHLPNNTEAEVRSEFNIEFLYVDVKDYQKQAFEQARKRWTSIILGDLPSQITLVPGTWCGFRIPSRRTVDDLLIGVRMVKIDGVGRVLGRAGPVSLITLQKYICKTTEDRCIDVLTNSFENLCSVDWMILVYQDLE